MLPSLSAFDKANHAIGDAIGSRDGRLSACGGANFVNLRRSELAAPSVPFALWWPVSPLDHFVSDVGRLRPEEQMTCVDAFGQVAGVKHVHAKRNRPALRNPCESVRLLVKAVPAHYSMRPAGNVLGARRANPKRATAVRLGNRKPRQLFSQRRIAGRMDSTVLGHSLNLSQIGIAGQGRRGVISTARPAHYNSIRAIGER